MPRSLTVFCFGLFSLFFIECLTLVLSPLFPAIDDCREFLTHQESVPRTLPFVDLKSPLQTREFRCALTLPTTFFSSRFAPFIRDRFVSIRLNNHDVSFSSTNAISFPTAFLRQGKNDARFTLEHDDAHTVIAFGMSPSLWSLSRLPLAIFALAVFLSVLWIFRRTYTVPCLSLLAIGGLLRILLTYASPYYLRSYDSWGHVQYILSLLEHHALPLVGSSWQAHQPPLYYLATLPIVFLQSFFFSPSAYLSLLTLNIQHLSLFLSLLSLFLSLEIVLLFPFSTRIRTFLFAFLALFPGHLFFTTQINNDVLLFVLSLYWLLLLLRASQKNALSRVWCFEIGLLVACAFLTKSNAFPLLFLTFLFLFYYRSSLRQFFSSAFFFSLPSFLLLAPYYLLRFLRDHSLDIAYNAPFQGLTVSLHPRVSEVLFFNPIALLRFPFQDTMDASSRSTMFFESLIKTAHFGTTFPLDANVLLTFFLGVLCFGLFGLYRSIFSSLGREWIVIFCTFLLSALAFRLLYPYASAQHFRYIPLILFPCAYFLGVALQKCAHSLLLRALSETLLALYLFSLSAYVVSIIVSS